MLKNTNTWLKCSAFIGLLCLLPLLLYGWYFWSNAGRSSDRYGVLSAMLKITLSQQESVSINGRPDMLLARAEYGEKYELNRYMRDLGWQYIEQMGAVSYFHKGNRKREVSHLAMTRHFVVYTLNPPHP